MLDAYSQPLLTVEECTSIQWVNHFRTARCIYFKLLLALGASSKERMRLAYITIVNPRYLKVEVHHKLLISQSIFLGPENILCDVSSLK